MRDNYFRGFLVGAAIGAVAGLLFAPQSGDKTRKEIKKLFGENPEEMKKQSKSMRSELNDQWKDDHKKLIDTHKAFYFR